MKNLVYHQLSFLIARTHHIVLLVVIVVASNSIGNAQNYALRFDGVNDYVTANGVADKVAEKDFTIEYWFRLNAIPTDFNSLAAFNQSDKSNRFETGVGYGDNQKFYVYSSYSSPETTYGTTDIVPGKWYHVAITYRHSDGGIDAFLNGKPELTKIMNRTYSVKVTDLFSLGQEWDVSSPTQFLNGDLDEFRVWDDLRTADEIMANMFRELNGNEANLVTYYKMNEGSGISLTDNSNKISQVLW
ncbi:LamG domain-containing protein [Acinetobacter sp.]|uniref:LamG domain-containing protein n=1 Tax=Acinetobacter sp. TaxID=472 RepID=UPI003D02526F